MTDARPLRPAYTVQVEFTICLLEGETLTPEQIAAIVKQLPSGGDDWRDMPESVKQVSGSQFPACEINRARLISFAEAEPCVSVTSWPYPG